MARTNRSTGASRSGVAVQLAQKSKVPAIAAGTAVAGVAGGVLIGRRSRRNGVAELTRQLGRAGRSAGELAIEVRRLREQASESDRQSPLEVVLSGLTSRRLPRH
jgi:hypothetical protein